MSNDTETPPVTDEMVETAARTITLHHLALISNDALADDVAAAGRASARAVLEAVLPLYRAEVTA